MKKILVLVYMIISVCIYDCIILDRPIEKPIIVIAEPYYSELPQPLPVCNINEEPAIEVETVDESPSPSYDLSAEDEYLLMKIAMAEAEGEDIDGKALVIMVILNRVASDKFPDTIEEVIYQQSNGKYQFSPISNGRFDRVEPNEDCQKALDMVMLDGWDDSQGALYFESCSNEDNWHSRNLEFLFKHGGHRFYK